MIDGFPPRESWGPGPWQTEPDALDWRDERTGLSCAIRRNLALGQLNGYVGVPPGHPFFGWGYNDDVQLKPEHLDRTARIGKDIGIAEFFFYAAGGDHKRGTIPLGMTLDAHGGINFSGMIENGERFHWFGFDCGHAFDMSPGLNASLRMVPGIGDGMLPYERMQTYRTIEYVKAECTRLAFQLKQLEAAVEMVTAEMNGHA